MLCRRLLRDCKFSAPDQFLLSNAWPREKESRRDDDDDTEIRFAYAPSGSQHHTVKLCHVEEGSRLPDWVELIPAV